MTDLIADLLRANLAASLAILLVFAVRLPARRMFGAEIAYRLWLVVPLAFGASLVPAAEAPAGAPGPSLPLPVALMQPDAGSGAALIWAAAYGHTDIAREFIGRGADPGVVDKYNCTARDEAERLGYAEIVQMIDGAEKQQMKPPQPRI